MKVSGRGTLINCFKPIFRADNPHFVIVDDDGKDDADLSGKTLRHAGRKRKNVPYAVSFLGYGEGVRVVF